MTSEKDTEGESVSTALSQSGQYAKVAIERLLERLWEWYDGLSKTKAVLLGSLATLIFSRSVGHFLTLFWEWISTTSISYNGNFFPSEYPLPLSTVDMIWVLFILVGLNYIGSMSSVKEYKMRELEDRIEQLEKKLEDKE